MNKLIPNRGLSLHDRVKIIFSWEKEKSLFQINALETLPYSYFFVAYGYTN